MAPGLFWEGPGVFFVLLLLLVPGCGRGTSPESRALLELTADTVQLEPGVSLVQVLVRSGTRDNTALEPDSVQIRSGDVVRFITTDGQLHSIAFETGQLSAEAETFLRQTSQLRSPPLIMEGSSWIVSFDGAPPGVYPFTDLAQDRSGTISVLPAQEEKVESR